MNISVFPARDILTCTSMKVPSLRVSSCVLVWISGSAQSQKMSPRSLMNYSRPFFVGATEFKIRRIRMKCNTAERASDSWSQQLYKFKFPVQLSAAIAAKEQSCLKKLF